jgi:hypothetical protein
MDKFNFQFTLGQISVPVFFEANCNIKSENQVKGKVKAKTTTTVLTVIRHNVQNVGRNF